MTPKPNREFELSGDYEGSHYRVLIRQFDDRLMVDFIRDGKALQLYQLAPPFPWETPKQIMGQAMGRIRDRASVETIRVINAMMGELHRVKTLDLTA